MSGQRGEDFIGAVIDVVSRYMAEAGVTEDDHALIREVAQDIARLLGSIRQHGASGMAVGFHRTAGSDYEAGWDAYSDRWESSVRRTGMRHLGDEWGSPKLTEEIITRYVKPYLPAEAICLEIGCGGGKFSEKLAPLCRVLICGDVSGKMLQRTKDRLRGVGNVSFEHLNGLDLHQFGKESIDFVFSFDCFVHIDHIDIEDTYCYLEEIRRVLRPGGRGLLHFANLNSDEGWKKFVTEAPINRGAVKHFDRFRFLTWEIVEKFFHSLGLRILASQREPWRDILVVFEK